MSKQVAIFTENTLNASSIFTRRAAYLVSSRVSQSTPWQTRRYARHKPATSPLADEKKRKSRSNFYSMKEIEKRRQWHLEAKPRVVSYITAYLQTSTPARNHSTEAVSAFAKALATDLLQGQKRTDPLSPECFAHHLRTAPGLSPDDLCGLANYITRKAVIAPRVVDHGPAFAGAKLLYTLASEGYVVATATLLCSQVGNSASTPNVTQTEPVKKNLERLKAYFEENAEIVFQSQSLDRIDAKHLEGLVWKKIGDTERALECMEQSWTLVEEGARPNVTNSARQTRRRLEDLFYVADPLWSDLYDAYLESLCGYVLVSSVSTQPDQLQIMLDLIKKMGRVLQMGLYTDDALAHYAFAHFQKIQSEVGAQRQASTGQISPWLIDFARRRLGTQRSVVDAESIKLTEPKLSLHKTKTWLFHMLRAAVSGMHQAAHELGDYYERRARELETDAAEAGMEGISPQQTAPTEQVPLVQRVLATLGFTSLSLLGDTLPTQEKRSNLGLARQWYQTAAKAWFAPSHLALARLAISELDVARSMDDQTTSSVLEDRVELVLRDCIRAAETQRNYEDVKSWEITDDIVSTENKLLFSKEIGFMKWRLFDNVFRSWVAPHDSHYEDMSARTAELCKKFGKDVYAEDGVLLYRHT